MSGFQLRRAARCLREGGIVAYPTEAVWGLGCDPFNADACLRLLALKQRDIRKGMILIAADWAPFAGLVHDPEGEIEARVQQPTDMATTWLVPASPGVPEWITGGTGRVAVRITRHPLAAAFCRVAGSCIVSTSANISGRRPARTALEVRCQFGHQLDGLLPGATGGADRPSQLIDVLDGRVLRN